MKNNIFYGVVMTSITEEEIYHLLDEIRPGIDFKEITNYADNGFFDSLDIIRLVASLDELFSISIDGSDIIPENFNSIDSMRELILMSNRRA